MKTVIGVMALGFLLSAGYFGHKARGDDFLSASLALLAGILGALFTVVWLVV